MHNRRYFEVTCYALSANDNSIYRHRIEHSVEHFKDVSDIKSDEMVAEMISKDGINILINLNGYTKGCRNEIFALRPAAIQVR